MNTEGAEKVIVRETDMKHSLSYSLDALESNMSLILRPTSIWVQSSFMTGMFSLVYSFTLCYFIFETCNYTCNRDTEERFSLGVFHRDLGVSSSLRSFRIPLRVCLLQLAAFFSASSR